MKQNVIEINFNFQGIHNTKSYFDKMVIEFNLPEFFAYSFDSLNDCMRDLSWIEENYLIINFLNIESLRSKNEKLFYDVKEGIETWQEYWNNSDKYSNYWKVDKCDIKTVVMTLH